MGIMLGLQIKEKRERKTYLNIKDGAIVKRTDEGEERYSYVEGILESIETRERNFRGEPVTYWYIDLRDGDSGEIYSLGFGYSSNIFKSIILQLASEDGIEGVKRGSVVRIEPYRKNDFDKVQVWGEGVRLNWVTRELPEVSETFIGGRRIKDDSKRMAFICSLAENIGNAIKKG